MRITQPLIVAAVGSALLTFVDALVPITIRGNAFYQPSPYKGVDGSQFVIVGVDYQPGGSSGYNEDTGTDPLSNGTTCLRDAVALQQLGVNTLRVYTINPDTNHDECMSILNAAGIYLILDVNSPTEALNRADPASTYNEDYLERVFKVIEAFKDYPNTLGFFSGNEVINDAGSASVSPPYILALQRDMKAYIAQNANRTIPVGYSAADDDVLRVAMWEYVSCGDTNSSSDFYAINSYAWCSGTSDWESSGYGTLASTFANTSIPIFFSEYGCIKNSPRTFDEVYDGVYGDLISANFSGGLVYEFNNEENNYGLVENNDNDTITLLQDYYNLQTAYSKMSFTTRSGDNLTASEVNLPECDTDAISALDSSFNTSYSLPDCPAPDLIENGVNATNVGKLIDLNETTSPLDILGLDGTTISNLTLDVPESNEVNEDPNQSVTSLSAAPTTTSSRISASTTFPATTTITTTSSSASASATKKNSGGNLSPKSSSCAGALFAAVALAVCVL